MDWAFNGVGTLVIGLVVGAGGGSAVTWRIVSSNNRRQTQKAGKASQQIQAGRDISGSNKK